MKKNELNYKDLRVVCNPEVFSFKSTQDLEPINTGIGQDRGIKALKFGLDIDIKGKWLDMIINNSWTLSLKKLLLKMFKTKMPM